MRVSTMDEYSSDLSLDDHLNLEAWLEEEKDESPIGDMPVELWSVYPADCHHLNLSHGWTEWLMQ
jgi:hypothetical protein